jgi:hypothetical protein
MDEIKQGLQPLLKQGQKLSLEEQVQRHSGMLALLCLPCSYPAARCYCSPVTSVLHLHMHGSDLCLSFLRRWTPPSLEA